MNVLNKSSRLFILLFIFAAQAVTGFTQDPCNFEIEQDANPTGDGLVCYSFFNRIVANDFVVPAGEDWLIQTFKPNIIIPVISDLDYIKVYIYADNQGKPGEVIMSQILHPSASTWMGTYNGKNVFEVELPIDNFYLAGHSDAPTVYWMGITGALTTSSSIEMEITVENGYGKPAMVSSGSGFDVAHPNWDGVFAIDANCVPINDHTAANEGYCETPSLAITQNQSTGCFGLATGTVGQSFTATTDEIAGVGVKLEKQSRGHEITLALWNKLPSQNGNILATVTTHTYGDKWVDVFFETPVALAQGQKYYILVTGSPDLPCIVGAGDVYSGGTSHGTPNYIANWDYDLTFRVYDCQEQEDMECSLFNDTFGNANAHLSSKNQSQLLATDLHIPVGRDFLLEEFKIYGWTIPGNSIINCDVKIYKDNNGKPGNIIAAFSNISPYAQNLVDAKYGYDIKEMRFQIPPLLLPGTEQGMEVYWISFNLGTTYGDAYITTDTFYNNGYPLMISSNNGEAWEALEGTDMAYYFIGQCFPTQGQTCHEIISEVDQPVDYTCLTNIQSGIAQSYTAVSEYATGVGVKFESVSFGSEVEIKLWDGLPNAGGEILASKNATTYGEQWVEIFWDHKIATTPGQQYVLTIHGNGLPCLMGTTNNTYAGGNFYKSPNFEPTQWSLTFKTYGCAAEDLGEEPDCEEEVTDDFTHNSGVKNTAYDEYVSANDLTVAPGENFTLTALSANIFANRGIFEAEVIYYDDEGGLPANVIGGQSQIPIYSQKVIGEGSGFDVNEIKIYVDPFEFHGQPEESTTYWIALIITDMHHTASTYWQTVATNAIGNFTAQKDASNNWAYIEGMDGVYKWEGNCSVMVGTTAIAFDDFSYYPNPASAYLQSSNPTRMDGIEIYNALGQRVHAEAVNNTSARIDIQALKPGIYFMQVAIGNERNAYKFIKE